VTTEHPAILGTIQRPGGEITLRYATAADHPLLLAFGRALPGEDLMFLRRDITQPEEIDAWVEDIRRGLNGTVLAVRDGEVLGYASVSRQSLAWVRHVAELRVVVAPAARGEGLGRALTEAAFRIGTDMNVLKLIAQMTLDQAAAMAVFKRLGFASEALLPDQVIDADGATHDLVVMSRRLDPSDD
jgi:L-amino acid N-acyltransferase YncA